MLCAHFAGNTARRNFWIVLMAVHEHARTQAEFNLARGTLICARP